MAMQDLRFKDINGNIQAVQFDPAYGIHPELSSDEQEWSVVATDPSGTETTDFIGRMPKK